MAGGLIGLLRLPISLGLGSFFPRSVSLQHVPCTTPQGEIQTQTCPED